jgi:deoxycytidine triphosphate deaminase
VPASGQLSAATLGLDLSRLPTTHAEAASRYERWQSQDPFPQIESALLNSADLFDYIAETGMIHPFEVHPDQLEETLKPASCGVRLGGKCIYWEYDDLGAENRSLEKTKLELDREGVLVLPPNSIVYATLAPTIRLPDYIAARFNLSIRYIYRGLLVGTGPLVDPGFQGRLSIPLHNLTAYECPIPTSDVILWMEFTKLSTAPRWAGHKNQARHGRYIEFPERKLIRKDVEDYVHRARNGKPIISSIPELTGRVAADAHRSADQAAKTAEEAKRARRVIQFAGAAALLALLIGLATFIYEVQHNIASDANTAISRTNGYEARLNALQAEVRAIRAAEAGPSVGAGG